ncbi:hypothetical protein GCM10010965_30150 [Caldalkalibacillus thermarum]|nr:hypothetical protein GCM10010965_30150 [Caldalkalibacillus thermarum]
MGVVVVWSLLLLIVILVLMIILIQRLLKRGNRFWTLNRLKWLSGAYLLILLLALALYYGLPIKETSELRTISYEEAEQRRLDFYRAVEQGKLAELEQDDFREQWRFETYVERLYIKLNKVYPEEISSELIVEQTDDTEGAIEVRYIMTPTVIEGIDLTDQLDPPRVDLQGEHLFIHFPDHQEVRLAHFSKAFTIKQFSTPEYMEGVSVPGASALYIRLPQHIELEASDNLPIRWVGQ